MNNCENALIMNSEYTIFTTNNCNSNCIMCPDSDNVRKKTSTISEQNLITQINSIPQDANFVCITGGEPTLLKHELLIFLGICRERLKKTDFLLLSNGRSFADYSYAQQFSEAIPNYLVVGIPIYSDNQNEHDEITRSQGSFFQTVQGIKNLIELGVSVEIRIVILKSNYKKLKELSEYIIKSFAPVLRVNFMGLELMGNAMLNKNDVWVEYKDTMCYLKEATRNLIANGVNCQLYNYPLCYVDKMLWGTYKKSITREKVRFKSECQFCKIKSLCGGFFSSTLAATNPEVRPYI